MDRRRFLAVTGATLLAGCGGQPDAGTTDRPPDRSTARPATPSRPTAVATRHSAGTPSTATTRAPRPAPAEETTSTSGPATSTATPHPEPSPAAFSASGNRRIEGVDVAGGLVVVDGNYRGSGRFVVTLDPTDGGRARRFVDATGPYEGAAAGLLEAGTYALEVVAEKTYWNLQVRQPRPSTGRSLPAYVDGNGPGVFGPYEFGTDGATAAASHSGPGTFVVEVLAPEGEFPTVVFDRRGRFAGETTFDPPGLGFVGVTVEGDWTLGLRD